MENADPKLKELVRDPVPTQTESKVGLFRWVGDALLRRQYGRLRAIGASHGDKRITVIMTAYNSALFIEKAVRSVLAQSHENFELMVIDDASEDDTLSVLKRLRAEDSRLRLFHSPKNHGTYWSKNWCLMKAESRYVAFHDSDDTSHADRLQVQLGAILDQPCCVASTVRWDRRDENGKPVSVNGRFLRLAAISLMIDRDRILDKAGYFDGVRIAADSEYLWRLEFLFGRSGVRHLRHNLYHGLLRRGSLMTGDGSGMDWSACEGSVQVVVTGDRKAYLDAARAWHRGYATGMDDEGYKLSFPQMVRPFEAPSALLKNSNDLELDQVIEIT